MVVERHRLDPKRSSELAHTKTFQPLLINQAQGCFQHPLPCERFTRFHHNPCPLNTYIVSLQRKYKAEKEGCQAIRFINEINSLRNPWEKIPQLEQVLSGHF